MQIMTIDYETFWSDTHSLTKITAPIYCMHPDTEIQSISIKKGGGSPLVLFGEDEIQAWADDTDFSDVFLLGHNMSGFDSMLAAWRNGIKPKRWGCTLAMAAPIHAKVAGGSLRALGEHYGLKAKGSLDKVNTKGKRLAEFTPHEIEKMRVYNGDDSDICYDLFRCLMPQTTIRELNIIDATIRMATEIKFKLDEPLLRDTLDKEKTRKRLVLVNLGAELDPERIHEGEAGIEKTKKDLGSAAKFKKILEGWGVEVPMKPSPANPDKMIPALAKTDEGMHELLAHSNELVVAAAQARLDVKSTLLETRIQRFLDIGEVFNGMMPIFLNYCGASTTWRWSGAHKLNQQNLPRINPKHPKLSDALRKCLTAPPGKKVVSIDLSGIELRVNHFLWRVPSSVRLYQADPDEADLYVDFAANHMYNVPTTDVTDEQRFVGKVAHLCLVEGTPVLTDAGIIPIEQVSSVHKVWDGVEWVSCSGATYTGEKHVISYGGITGTPEHKVYLQSGESCTLKTAADKNYNLLESGISRDEDWPSRNNKRSTAIRKTPQSEGSLRRLWVRALCGYLQPVVWAYRWVRSMFPTSSCPEVASEAPAGGEVSVRQPQRQGVQQLRRAGDSVSVYNSYDRGGMGSGPSWAAEEYGVGSLRQQRPLRTWKFTLGITCRQWKQQAWSKIRRAMEAITRAVPGSAVCGQHPTQSILDGANEPTNSSALEQTKPQTKRRVWDILDAGPRHRFTANNRIVHNSLGFNAGAITFRAFAKNYGEDIPLDEAQTTVNVWRATYGQIVRGWTKCHGALPIINKMRRGIYEYALDEDGNKIIPKIDPWGFCTPCKEGIKTPMGMIRYPELRQEYFEQDNGSTRREWVYNNRRKRPRIYGGKMDENIVQHLAREVLADMWLAYLKTEIGKIYPVAHTVHDELIFVCYEEDAEELLETMVDIMAAGVDWWPELVTSGKGAIGDNYGETH